MDRFDGKGNLTEAATRHGRGPGFLRSEDGSLIIFGLMLFLLMLVAGGMGVDFMRFESQRARLQATLDRAVLAAASMDQPLEPTEVVMDYFDKAGLGPYIDAEDIHVTDTVTSRRVEAQAEMTVGATFLRFAGIDQFIAPAAGAAQESASQTEISLILDTSGSMGSRSASGKKKIEDLREAATKFVNIVLCDPAFPDRTSPCTVDSGKVSVSIVPYSEQVLVGEELLGYFNPTMEHTYSSCVDWDATDFTTTSVTPTQVLKRAGHFDPWRGPNSTPASFSCDIDSWRAITAVSGSAATLRSRISKLGAEGNTSIDIAMKWGAALLDPAAQPVVDNLIAAGKTDEDFDGRPRAWGEDGISKVIVLMTDGVNTDQHYLYDNFRSGASPVYYYDNDPDPNDPQDLLDKANKSGHSLLNTKNAANPLDDEYYWLFLDNPLDYPMDRPYGAGLVPVCKNSSDLKRPWRWNDTSKCKWEEGPGASALDYPDVWAKYTWAWWNSWRFLSQPGNAHGYTTKNSRLESICGAAKEQGITVFTIGFEVTNTSGQILQQCATDDAYYFNSSGLDLSSSFAAIAREISKLRLVN